MVPPTHRLHITEIIMNGDSRINFCMERTSHECLLMFVSHVHKEWQTNDLLTELAVCGYHTQCTLDEHYGPSVGQKLTPSTVSFALVTITRDIKCIALAHAYVSKIPIRKCGTKL
jgi:hypothetical protein